MEWGALAAAAISAAASFGGAYMTNQNNQNLASAQQFNDIRTAQFQADYGRVSEQIQQHFAREMAGRSEAFQLGNQQNAFNQQNAMLDKTMSYNNQLMGRQEDFQREMMNAAQRYNTEMSNTSYQRGVADMRAAGINPMLAYGQGGATAPTVSVPSGASGSVSAPSAPTAGAPAYGNSAQAHAPSFRGYQRATMENMIGPALSSAVQGAKILTELEQMQANLKQTRVQTAYVGGPQTEATGAAAGLSREQTALSREQAQTEGARRTGLLAQAQAALMNAIQSGASAREIDQRVEVVRQFGVRGSDPGAMASQAGGLATGDALRAPERLRQGARDAGESAQRGVASAMDAAGSVLDRVGSWISRMVSPTDEDRERNRRAVGEGAYNIYRMVR